MAQTVKEVALARGCDGCTLCCKLLGIGELNKPRLKWCPHCEIGVGCRIYDTRPGECRQFNCGYLLNGRLGPHWKPSRARIVIAYRGDPGKVSIHVDPDRPDAWLKQPYYSEIMRWVVQAARRREPVILWLGRQSSAIVPAPGGRGHRLVKLAAE